MNRIITQGRAGRLPERPSTRPAGCTKGLQVLTVPACMAAARRIGRAAGNAASPAGSASNSTTGRGPARRYGPSASPGRHARAARGARGAVLVAHSFGCTAVLRQAALDPSGIAGALLVAPADPEIRRRRLAAHLAPALPSLLVASRDDPGCRSAPPSAGARCGAANWSTWASSGTSMPNRTRRVARRAGLARDAAATDRRDGGGRAFDRGAGRALGIGGGSRADGSLYLNRLKKCANIRSVYKGRSAESVS